MELNSYKNLKGLYDTLNFATSNCPNEKIGIEGDCMGNNCNCAICWMEALEEKMRDCHG